jgi:hypothetical protein
LASSIQGRRTNAASINDLEYPAVVVNPNACRKLAAWLKAHEIPVDREDSSLAGLSAKQIGNFYFLLVAICHQTSPRGRPALEGTVNTRHLRGWDYLSAKLEAAARANPHILSPGFWAKMTSEQMRDIFRDAEFGERLSNPEHRVELARDLGQQMRDRGWTYAHRMHEIAKGRIATGSPNLLGILREFRAYNDPVHKKKLLLPLGHA